MSSRVFVGNLGFGVTREQLTRTLSEAGEVVSVSIPVDRETQRPRGFAFVEFSQPEEAKRAIEQFDGHTLEGRPLRLSEAIERGSRGDRPAGRSRSRSDERSEPAVAAREDWNDSSRSHRQSHREDYGEKRRERPRRGGRHGSDRKRGKGTRRTID